MTHEPVGHLWQEALWGSGADLWLQERGLTDVTIKEAGLGYVATPLEGWESFVGCVSIPYFDGRGREVGVRFRHLTGNQKYDQRRGSPHKLYGLDQVEEATVHITEGEFDSLILRQLGLASVGCPGAASWQPHWRWLFRDCEVVKVVFDGDEAGHKGAFKLVRGISKLVPQVEVVEMPEGQDVTDLYLSDPEELRRVLA